MGPRILLIDDNPDDRALAVRELRRGFGEVGVTEVGGPAAFDAALADWAFDAVVTDHQLHWSDGIAVLRAVRARHPHCPVVMFTASGSQEVAVEAMKAGLDDYVVKSPRHLVRLSLAVRTALQRAQASRRATLLEVQQQRLLNRLSVGVCRFGLDGRLLECNPAFLRLCGVDALEAARQLDLTPLLLRPAERERLFALAPDDGHHALWDAALTRADGASVGVSVNATLSTGPTGDLVVDCLVEDVTERRRLTDELRAANAAKDQFLAVLSHELRTPLTPVLATVTAMEDDAGLSPPLRAAIGMIRRNVELEARIIDDLLDLTRIAKGKMLLNVGTIDAHALVRDAIEICQSEVYGKGLTVDLRLVAARHHIRADAARFQQIVWNLLKNAVKFTPAGGRLAIRTSSVDGGGGRLRLEVSDTGVGIAAGATERIFDAFQQADESIGRRFGGLGLGLAISRALAAAHGGTLVAASPGENAGATFTLEMPLADPASALTHPHAGATAGDALPPLRILLVEDHADTLHVLTRLLSGLGHDVRTAATVAAALERAAERRYDLVVSDLGLPDGNGVDLMRKLRDRYGLVGIAVSGFGMEEDVRRSREGGFVAHLTKPVNFQQLQAVIRQVVRPAPRGEERP